MQTAHFHRSHSILKRLTVCKLSLLAIWLTSGCAPLTHAQKDDREYRRVDYELKFRDFRRQCLNRGGRIVIDAQGTVGRDGMPSRGDRYFCA